AHDNCNRTAGNPEHCTPLKVHCQVWRFPGAPADTMCVNWAQQRRKREYEEIDPAGRAALDIVRIDFFDNAVGNHRGARCHPEDEHPQLRRNGQWMERDWSARQHHYCRAPYDYGLSPPDTVVEPAEQRTSEYPA